MDPPVEILVHISAPSMVQDDATYRKQVEAYLGFEAEKRHEVLTRGRHPQDTSQKEPILRSQLANTTKDGQELAPKDNRRDGNLRDFGTVYLEQDFSGDVLSMTDKVLETPNFRKPSALERFKGATAIQIELSPNYPLPKASNRGGLLPKAILVQPALELPSNAGSTTTDRILETPNSRKPSALQRLRDATAIQIERTPNDQRPRTAPSELSKQLESTPLRRVRSGSWETPPSVVPDSQPSYKMLKRNFADSSKDSFPDSLSWMDHSPRNRRSPSPSQKRLRQEPPSPKGVPLAASFTYTPKLLASTATVNTPEETAPSAVQSTSPTSASTPQPLGPAALSDPPEEIISSATQSKIPPCTSMPQPLFATTAPAASSATPSSVLPLYVPNRSFFTIPPPTLPSPPQYIAPPPPRASNTPFVTHLTPSLLIAPNALPLAEHYVPLSTTRPIGILDRGYWHIPIASFAPDVRASFWDFMMQFVQESRAGWDAALVLEEGGSGPWGEVVEGEEGEGLVVKVFGWGEVVGHLWLILWVASQRKITGVGATWRDYSGEVIVTME